jgi:hypothetical protein
MFYTTLSCWAAAKVKHDGLAHKLISALCIKVMEALNSEIIGLAGSFDGFFTSKLTAYISILSYHNPDTAQHNLRKQLIKIVASRKTQHSGNISSKKQKQQSTSCTIPYTSNIWNTFKLQKVLSHKRIKQALPLGSELGKRKLVIYHKYSRVSKVQCCNYTTASRCIGSPDIHRCVCNHNEYEDYIDKHHMHVMTCDMSVIGTDVDAQRYLELGTKYRDNFIGAAFE